MRVELNTVLAIEGTGFQGHRQRIWISIKFYFILMIACAVGDFRFIWGAFVAPVELELGRAAAKRFEEVAGKKE